MTATTPRKPGRPAKVQQPEGTEFEPILMHVVIDGFTAFGTLWLAGQEIEVDEVHYQATLDREGNSWLDFSEEQQISSWGVIKFVKGPSTIPNSLIEYVEDFRDMPKTNTYSWFDTANEDKAKLAKAEVARGRSIPSF